MSLYVWGSNKFKQLNNQRELHSYAPVYIPSACGDNVPIAVAAGESHTLVLCESGDIYSFGRGRDGQLGHGELESTEAKLVGGLNDETIVDISAGSLSSYAVTSTGNVYQWGLVYRKIRAVSRDHGLHGLAQDQDNVYIEADMEARAHEEQEQQESADLDLLAQSATNSSASARNQDGHRQLRDIVRDSTEQWQLPTYEANAEYLDELRAMGLQPEQLRARMAQRNREYQEMLAEGCTRAVQPVPERVPHLGNIRVKTVSSGYAHVMLLSDEGRLYGAGYNDRGQLGLGHRINTSEFKPLDFLANKFVLQVACGQQHSICRAVERDLIPQLQALTGAEYVVGADCGADAYVWGNGTLGQLGLGMKGTTKGRMFPTRNATLHQLFPRGIVDVSAGANFTAAVTHTGVVYSFGHSEYNQHGDNTRSNRDYVDAHHYFLPQPVTIETTAQTGKPGNRQEGSSSAKRQVHVKRIKCGANFTIAIDDRGDLYSWGWNESGVLGHGVRHFAAWPQRIETIGASFDGCRVRAVSAGGKHVVALADAQGHAWAASFHSILESDRHVDCVVDIQDAVADTASRFAPGRGRARVGDDGDVAPVQGATRQTSFPCHRAILSARSTFLRGYINAALHEQQDTLGKIGDMNTEKTGPLRITLPSRYANAITVRSLLDYLYLDRVQIASHKRAELETLADDLGIERLRQLLHGDESHHKSLPSVFTANMARLLNSPEHADVVFVCRSLDGIEVPSVPAVYGDQEDSHDTPVAGIKVFDATEYDFVLYAHRAVIGSRLPYFEAMLTSGFAESGRKVRVCAPFGASESVATLVDVSGLVAEGIDLPVLEMVLMYAYTGQFQRAALTGSDEDARPAEEEAVDLNAIMAVLVAANRLGFTTLLQHCERLLSLHLGDYFPHNATNCLEFATAYNIPRLERQCRELLRKAEVSSGSAGAGKSRTKSGRASPRTDA